MNFFFKLEIVLENHPSHTPYKKQKDRFRSCSKTIMANKLLSTNLERFLRPINSPPTR